MTKVKVSVSDNDKKKVGVLDTKNRKLAYIKNGKKVVEKLGKLSNGVRIGRLKKNKNDR